MLVALGIRNIVLIDRLDLTFGPGLGVLTGETGAGKSILLDAFALALGARGDGALVRRGAREGAVRAVFELPRSHACWAMLDEAGIDIEDDRLILRRIQLADGRTRAFVNDVPVGVQLLRRIGASLVEIHGQDGDRALAGAEAHRDLLDAFAGLGDDVAAVGAAWHAWREAEAARAAHEAELARAREEADYLAHAHEELQALDPQPGEEDTLAERRALMMHAERMAEALGEAREALAGDRAIESRLAGALRRLERQAASASAAGTVLEPVVKALDRALVELGEARAAVDEALGGLAFETSELERIEERLFALRALARKHRVAVADLPGLARRLDAQLHALAQGESRARELAALAEAARRDFEAGARALSERRRKAAARLDSAVGAELADLRLEKARFTTRIETAETPEAGGAHGLDRVTFEVQTNPDTAPGPLMKIASGGERSRFILALKVVLAARGSAPTLIFDEIDTGMGGATASAIGDRLARLGRGLQVLAITHSPQVAAEADHHLHIVKEVRTNADGEETVTRVVPLAAGDRREEIARMLAGAEVTDEARRAAERLMAARG